MTLEILFFPHSGLGGQRKVVVKWGGSDYDFVASYWRRGHLTSLGNSLLICEMAMLMPVGLWAKLRDFEPQFALL